jgi:hypothetical protein
MAPASKLYFFSSGVAGTRILLEPVESTWEPVAGNVNAPECLVSADDKSINIQSLVSIVKFLLYYHMSSAELKDRGKSLGAERAKGKWSYLAPIIGVGGLRGSPSRPPPLNVLCLSIYSEQKTRSFGILANLI